MEEQLPHRKYGQMQFAIYAEIRIDDQQPAGCCLKAELKVATGPKVLYDQYQIVRDGIGVLTVLEHEMQHYHVLTNRFLEVMSSISDEVACYSTPDEAESQADLLDEYFNSLIRIHIDNESTHDGSGGHGTPSQPDID